ncbi:MAG: rhodanese-like domain-containing protein [Bryobacteraceae bacterium]
MANRLLLVFLPLAFIFLGSSNVPVQAQAGKAGEVVPREALMPAQEMAGLISKSNRPRPTLIYVGYHSLFLGAHIPGAIFAGPDSKPEGIEQLKAVVRNIPHKHAIVVYCGCCPFDRCPNVGPAYRTLKDLGFERVSVVHIPTNLHTDWVQKGYPVTKGAGY